ncbi:hypothetical protein [Metabacillus fastidiosus]|uniref:hypothetical protein n=1 Tax=Metabacillus fastidiosus TaxID=1458 RepID=UPI003D2B8D51
MNTKINQNVNLAYQIREGMYSDSQIVNACLKNSTGTIEFFIRDNNLQKIKFSNSFQIMGNSELLEKNQPDEDAMADSGFKQLVGLLANFIKRSIDTYQYSTIVVRYQVNEDGQSLKDLRFDNIKETHFKRR